MTEVQIRRISIPSVSIPKQIELVLANALKTQKAPGDFGATRIAKWDAFDDMVVSVTW